MTEVGFYHLLNWPLERAMPKLLEKVLERGHRAIVMAGSRERVEALNALLWTYEERSWLPHGSAGDGDPAEQPIFLTEGSENLNGADVLLTVDGREAGDADAFARVIDMFDGRDEAAVAAARERWRRYTEQGLTLTYWQQTERGGWEKKA
ncbi:MAG: DNA polymerase III subunit chi [Alphaproteobacteria bacterium]|jgi:DNA polymerase-3 subunit chi|nr:DNA polymerase III subunit chi [Alphaproteobacteria bacterium]MDP6565259.1 DNA polymerase III subunit chi [Alphaproteobacteria bacterium]MDP6813635.1 DNA polymerase III subunit chi [Alphaproteobacteria bacterium]